MLRDSCSVYIWGNGTALASGAGAAPPRWTGLNKRTIINEKRFKLLYYIIWIPYAQGCDLS